MVNGGSGGRRSVMSGVICDRVILGVCGGGDSLRERNEGFLGGETIRG